MYPTIKKITALVLSLLLLVTISGCSQEQPAVAVTTAPTAAPRQLRSGLQTFLIASLKEFTPETGGVAYRNPEKADMLMLMILDESSKTITSLQLNPDTLVSFTPQGTHDALEIPLGESYSYGSGGSDSCLNLMKSMSSLLGGVSLQHYMFFTLDAVGIVNDLIGGVDVEIMDNLPGFTKGETVHLSGSTTTDYFDFRDASDTDNSGHMSRQQQYIAKSYIPFTQHVQQENFLTRLTIQLGERMDTDMTLSQMAQMLELMGSCTMDENIHTLSGTAETVNGQFRFRADANSIDQILNTLFY